MVHGVQIRTELPNIMDRGSFQNMGRTKLPLSPFSSLPFITSQPSRSLPSLLSVP